MVNQAHLSLIGDWFHTSKNTMHRLITVLNMIAAKLILPEIDFFPKIACIRKAKKGDSTTSMLA